MEYRLRKTRLRKLGNKEVSESKEVMVIKSKYGIGFCGNCHGSVWQNKDESKYCFRCGAKLVWGVKNGT